MDEALVRRVRSFEDFVARVEHQRDNEVSAVSRFKSKIQQLEKDKTQLVKVIGLLDRAVQIVAASGISKIESIVTAGLQLVFDDPNVSFVVEKKDGARGNSFRLLIRAGDVIGEPMDVDGGGAVNTIVFLLRIILIKRFQLGQLIVLDESFNNVSSDLQGRVSELLAEMAHKYKFTIVAVTQQPRLIRHADVVYRVISQKDGPVLKKFEGADLEELKASSETQIA